MKIKPFSTRLWFVLKYWILAIVFFELARVFFLLQNFALTKSIGFRLSILSMIHGFMMDASMATYLVLPIIIFLLLSVFTVFFRTGTVYQIYTGLVLFILLFLIIADIGIFNSWGFRLDASPIKYLKSPNEAWASIQHLPLFWGGIFFLLIFFLVLFANNRFIKNGLIKIDFNKPKFFSVCSLLVLGGVFIIPLRGGLQLSPINQSSVYFSQNNFANQAALNAPWNLMYSLDHSSENSKNNFINMPMGEAEIISDSLFAPSKSFESFIDIKKVPSPNVILIIWESFTRKVVDMKRDGVLITPGFNQLKNEGMYFSNIYAAGDRTDKGLSAILSAYPAEHDISIIKVPTKAAKLPMLSSIFYKQHYETSFYYGGETEFANMKAYLLLGNFDKLISVVDFNKQDLNSKWGAHDEVVMNRMFNDIKDGTLPQFATWLTLSSHEPFEVPVKNAIPGTDEESLFLNSLHYTDSVIYNFVQKCKNEAWWSNTIVVITADHGRPLPRTNDKEDEFKTSLLFLGGAITKRSINSKVGSQLDIAATLLAQLQINSSSFPWSRNLSDVTATPWSFFNFNNGFGFVDAVGAAIFDNTGNRLIEQRGTGTRVQLKKGKALQQFFYQDYLDK
ncbi:MAG: sulfatase-like hydrolase/transferase [Ferruginibacter sp.]